MSETDPTPTPEWWDFGNKGIVGLGPDDGDGIVWPTEGYDGPLVEWARGTNFSSGRTREEWLRLADVMVARWQAWRAQIATADAHFFRPSEGP